jgi:hypothetical protein
LGTISNGPANTVFCWVRWASGGVAHLLGPHVAGRVSPWAGSSTISCNHLPFSFTCHRSFTVTNLIICFFLLKTLRYFNVYNPYEVCWIKKLYTRKLDVSKKIFCRKKRMIKIATVKVRWHVNENGGSNMKCAYPNKTDPAQWYSHRFPPSRSQVRTLCAVTFYFFSTSDSTGLLLVSVERERAWPTERDHGVQGLLPCGVCVRARVVSCAWQILPFSFYFLLFLLIKSSFGKQIVKYTNNYIHINRDIQIYMHIYTNTFGMNWVSILKIRYVCIYKCLFI